MLCDRPSSVSQVRLITLKDELLDIEMESVESLSELVQEFDRNYSEIAEANKAHYNAFFTQVRPLLIVCQRLSN